MTASAITSVDGARGSTPTCCSHDHHVDLWSGDDVVDRYSADELGDVVTTTSPSPTATPTIDHAIAASAASAALFVPVDRQPIG